MTGDSFTTVPTFSAQTFAKLSPHPYMLANLDPADNSRDSQRTNGRQPGQSRPLQLNLSSLTHANGSAMIRLGDTTVVCGIRAETLPISEIPNYRPRSAGEHSQIDLISYDLLVPNIELATGSAPEFLPGAPPSSLAQTLSTRLYTLLLDSKMIKIQGLMIWDEPTELHSKQPYNGDENELSDDESGASPGQTLRGFWTLYIDVTFASYDGNPFDAAWTAVLAALHDVKLPKAWWDADREGIVCSSAPADSQKLQLRGFPVACSGVVFTEKDYVENKAGKYWVLIDPDRREERLCQESICMVVDCGDQNNPKMLSISKYGGCVLDRKLIGEFRELAKTRWREYKEAFDSACYL